MESRTCESSAVARASPSSDGVNIQPLVAIDVKLEVTNEAADE